MIDAILYSIFATRQLVAKEIQDAIATRGITIDVANYTDLITNYPAASNNGAFAWVENSQGTAWLPGNLGGTYYPLGLYHSNGTAWIFTPSPSQATQSEVDTGTNNDKFVTPSTLANDSKWATKQAAVTVSNTSATGHFPLTFVSANGALTALNTNSSIYASPSEGAIVSPYVTCSMAVNTNTVNAVQFNGTYITSANGGDSVTSALSLSGNNGYGGTNYFGAITLQNTGATNGNKYIRINASGGIEIINSAYSATIWSLSNSGSSYSPTVTGDNINASSAVSAGTSITAGTTISATGTITSNSSTSFRATGSAVNNVSLEVANTSALRNIGDLAENHMYFDINTGGSNIGHFTFRGTNSYTTYADISPSGILALTPYKGKSSYNVALDTVVTVDNLKFRITNSGGIFPQVASASGSTVDVCYSGIGIINGLLTQPAWAHNSGYILAANGTWLSVYSSHGLDTRGDQFVMTITDKSAEKIYRVTYLVTNNSGNATGYNILVERII